MQHIETRNGWWYVRIKIPDDVKHAFPHATFKQSLKTRDPAVAARKALPIIDKVQALIRRAREAPSGRLPAASGAPRMIDPDRAREAIRVWYEREVKDAYWRSFNGLTEPMPPLGAEREAANRLHGRLNMLKWRDIDGFDERLTATLRGEGVEIAPDHPMVPNLRLPFCKAWYALETITLAFRAGDFSGWDPDEEGTPIVAPPARNSAGSAAGLSKSGLALGDVVERYVDSRRPDPKDESEIRLYVRRLCEFAGDPPLDAYTPELLDRFLIKLRQMPVTRLPEVTQLPFNELIARYGTNERFVGRRLANKTIRTKWFGAYNRLFKYACSTLEALPANPVSDAMPSKKDDEPEVRVQWTPEEIGRLFAAPLFTGSKDASDWGYRLERGEAVQRDAKFWLPIVSLWSGLRLGELGAMKTEEVRLTDGVWIFDLEGRPLRGDRRVKNRAARRRVPVHQTLIDLGFIEYRSVQGEWLFPDLWAKKRPEDTVTAQYSKWFGLWRAANGLTGRWKDFHALRHTFKEACREAKLHEDVHDRLTGHSGSANQSVSRGYGRSEVAFLKRAIDRVKFPTFPDLTASGPLAGEMTPATNGRVR